MKNLLFKYFLSLSVLLLGGYGQLSTYVLAESASLSQEETIEESLISELGLTDPGLIPQLKSTTSGTKKGPDKNDLTEIEEEEEKDERERSSSKRQVKGNYFTDGYYAHLPGDYFRYIKKCLSLRKYTYLQPSDRSLNILFCVIRI